MTAKTAFDNIIKRAENILKLQADFQAGLKTTSTFTNDERATLESDLLSTSLVTAVAALDRYVHDRVTKGVVAAYRNDNLTKEQQDFSIPVSVAFVLAQKAAEAKAATKQARAANLVRNEIQELLHKRPFQSWREIETAFSILGVSGLAGKIQTSLKLPDLKGLKGEIAKIAKQRNLIVHEGGIKRHQRGGKPSLISIDASFVQSAIATIKNLVTELDKI